MLTLGAILPAALPAAAQDAATSQSNSPIVIEPLFEYPVAPDSLPTLEEKSTYLVEHFWDAMDWKNKQAVDQNALNDAFMVFSSPMRWADVAVTNKAVDAVIRNTSKNPVLALQMARAAEEAFYGPRAIYWSDPLYIRFIDNVLGVKKIPQARKERFLRHRTLLENSKAGNFPKEFEYVTADGKKSKYRPDGVITVIEFGNPDCDDCRYAKLMLDTDLTFSTLVEKGQINMLFVIPDPEPGWESMIAEYPKGWHSGASEGIDDVYDIRIRPSFYVIGHDGKIIAKNVNYLQAKALAVKEADKK